MKPPSPGLTERRSPRTLSPVALWWTLFFLPHIQVPQVAVELSSTPTSPSKPSPYKSPSCLEAQPMWFAPRPLLSGSGGQSPIWQRTFASSYDLFLHSDSPPAPMALSPLRSSSPQYSPTWPPSSLSLTTTSAKPFHVSCELHRSTLTLHLHKVKKQNSGTTSIKDFRANT